MSEETPQQNQGAAPEAQPATPPPQEFTAPPPQEQVYQAPPPQTAMPPPPQQGYMPPPPPMAFAPGEVTSESKLLAFLCYCPGIILIGILIVLLSKKEDRYAVYHAKQGLVLLLGAIIVSFACGIIPGIGWFVFFPIAELVIFVLMVIGIINAFSGELKPLPIIGQFADKFNF